MNPSSLHSSARLLCGALLLTAPRPPAQAQDWPNQPLRILVGSSPGGGTDAMARAVADKLGPLLKTTVVVENRPGASNTLAADATAKSTDGHTMVMGVVDRARHRAAPAQARLRQQQGPGAGGLRRRGAQRAGGQQRRCRRQHASPSWSRWRRSSPASSTTPPAARAARSTSRPSCSRTRPAPSSPTFPTAAAARR